MNGSYRVECPDCGAERTVDDESVATELSIIHQESQGCDGTLVRHLGTGSEQ